MSQDLESWDQPKKAISLEDMDKAIAELRKARDEYAEASKKSKDLNVLVKKFESEVISLMQQAGKKRYIAEGIGAISLETGLSVQTPKTPEQKESFFSWLKSEMGEDGYLTYATVNSASLNKLYRDKVEEYAERGEVLEIEGLDQPTSYTKLSLRKA